MTRSYLKEKEAQLKYKYGITLDEFNSRLEAQDHKCAICYTEIPGGLGTWHVDHCHETNKVRGLLCSRCNLSLGGFQDNIVLLLNAIKYLEESRNVSS